MIVDGQVLNHAKRGLALARPASVARQLSNRVTYIIMLNGVSMYQLYSGKHTPTLFASSSMAHTTTGPNASGLDIALEVLPNSALGYGQASFGYTNVVDGIYYAPCVRADNLRPALSDSGGLCMFSAQLSMRHSAAFQGMAPLMFRIEAPDGDLSLTLGAAGTYSSFFVPDVNFSPDGTVTMSSDCCSFEASPVVPSNNVYFGLVIIPAANVAGTGAGLISLRVNTREAIPYQPLKV